MPDIHSRSIMAAYSTVSGRTLAACICSNTCAHTWMVNMCSLHACMRYSNVMAASAEQATIREHTLHSQVAHDPEEASRHLRATHSHNIAQGLQHSTARPGPVQHGPYGTTEIAHHSWTEASRPAKPGATCWQDGKQLGGQCSWTHQA